MCIKYHPYSHSEFLEVRDFLIRSYSQTLRPYNWTLERWEFAFTLDRVMHNIDPQQWADRTGIWEDSHGIAGLVTADGPGGNAYPQLRPGVNSVSLVHEMLEFAEAKISHHGTLKIWFPPDALQEQVARDRGYSPT